jgi:hypothetical protein
MLDRSPLASAARICALFGVLGLGALPLGCAAATAEDTPRQAPAEPVAEAQEPLTTCLSIRRGLGASVVADAHVAEMHPTDNMGSATALWAGGTPGNAKVGLVRFDLSAIPRGSVITSATLGMRLLGGGGSPVNLHRATAAWSEPTVTWASFAGAFDPAVLASFQSVQGPVTANVKSIVQAWVSGAYENDGFALDRALTTNALLSSSEDTTATNRPQLDVCYTPPTTFSGNVNGGYKTFAGSQAVFGGRLAIDGSNRMVFVARMTIDGTADFGGGVIAPQNGYGWDDAVVKVTSGGAHVFSLPINWGNVYNLASDAAGDTFLVVSCSIYNPSGCAVGSTPLPGHSVVKLDPAGNVAWIRPTKWGARVWASPAGDAYVQDFDLYYYAVPNTLTKYDAAGNTAWSRTLAYHVNTGALGPNGDLYLTAQGGGGVTFAGTPVNGSFLGKLSPSGAEVWATDGVDPAGILAVDPWDRPTTVYNQTYLDYYLDDYVPLQTIIDRYDASGALLSSSVLGSSPPNLQAASAAFDAAGNLVVSGTTWGVPSMNLGGADIPLFACDPAWSDYDLCQTPTTYYGYAATDAFLVKLDATGGHLSSTIFGDPAMQSVGDVVIDSQNRTIAIGSFSSSQTPAHFSFPTAHFLDMFLTRYQL